MNTAEKENVRKSPHFLNSDLSLHVQQETETDRNWYRGADKSLARPGREQARKHVRDARDFNNIETRAVIKFFFLQGKAPKEIHAILTETLACFLPGRAKGLPAPLYTQRSALRPVYG